MKKTVSKSHFKTHAMHILRQVEFIGDSVIVTDERGHPSVEIRRYSPDDTPMSASLERLRGSVLRYDAPVDPAADPDDWEAMR